MSREDDLPSLAELKSVWSDGGDAALQEPLENVCVASRDPSLRDRLTEDGLLEFAVEILQKGPPTPPSNDDPPKFTVITQALRVAGNLCADNNENRKKFVDLNAGPDLIRCFEEYGVLTVAIPATYNICVDYEPAQKHILADGKVASSLLHYLPFTYIDNEPGMPCAFDLLEMSSSVDDGNYAAWPEASIELLAKWNLPTKPDSEHFCSLANTTVNLLRSEKFRQLCIASRHVHNVFTLLEKSYFIVRDDADLPKLVPSDEANLQVSRLGLMQALSDLSSDSAFPPRYPPNSDFVKRLRARMDENASWKTLLPAAACMILGNLVRSDDTSIQMVQELHLTDDILKLKISAEVPEVTFASLGLVKHLAIPSINKKALADSKLLEMLCGIIVGDKGPQNLVLVLATSVVRLLIMAETASRVLEALKIQTSDLSSVESSRTSLETLLTADSREPEAQKIERARLIAQLVRSLANASNNRIRELYDDYPSMCQALWVLTQQKENVPLQLEGWFAIALMSTIPEGLEDVVRYIEKGSLLPELVLRASTREPKLRDNLRILVNNLKSELFEDAELELLAQAEHLLWNAPGEETIVTLERDLT